MFDSDFEEQTPIEARVHIPDVRRLGDVALIKNLVDLLQAATRGTVEAVGDDSHQRLWPETTPTNGDDTIFQSPRMVESAPRRDASGEF